MKVYDKICELLGMKDLPDPCWDMTKRDHEEAADVDVYLAGFPCPSYSALGHREGVLDQRGQVIFHCLEYCVRHCPAIVPLENVKGILQKQHSELISLIKQTFKQMGYKFYLETLNTSNHGIPQWVYMVAIRADKMKMGKEEDPEGGFVQADPCGRER